MIIGVDIDGVILDFERLMRTYAEFYDLLFLEKKGIVNPQAFAYLDKYDWTEKERKEFVDMYLIKNTFQTNLLPCVKEALTLLKTLNFKIIIISQRGLIKKETQLVVHDLLKEKQIPYDDIYFAIKDKLKLCQELNINYMIEDNPDICVTLSNNKIKTYYLKDCNIKLLENNYLKEVNNWGEICRDIIQDIPQFKSNKSYQKLFK